ncbi:hypothetical protein ACF0H5_000933 [Mactra antiquata]
MYTSVVKWVEITNSRTTKCFSVVEGCGRVPATPPPTTPPAPTEPTINGSVRALECTSAETNETACLNGGTCFVFVLAEIRTATCNCPREYEGIRCQKLNIDVIVPPPSQEADNIAKAGIAASIVVLIIIVVVFTAVFIVYRRRKKREEEEKKHKPVNGSLLPENSHQPPNPNMQYAKNGGNLSNMNLEEKKPLQQYQITSV